MSVAARVRLGVDVAHASGWAPLRGLRVGAICHPASLDSQLRHLADLLASEREVQLRTLFGPEHGVRGEAQDMVSVSSAHDRTGRPVYSLYGNSFESLAPHEEMLEGLEALVFDCQDVGARYYTFIYTMALAMKAAARAHLKFVVLDRPNPLGGAQVEGNVQRAGFTSFVGLYPLPVRHGLTIGEVARLLNAEHHFGCELEVVPMEGWRRPAEWEETGLFWAPPSPNMPTPDTARVYPGMCLVEGTNLSEGRGTTRPFETVGAPFLDPYALAESLAAERLPGCALRPLYFQPTFHKWAGQTCGGVMVHVTDRETFRPFLTGVAFVRAARALAPERFRWRTERYEFVDDVPAFDLLCGTDRVRQGIESGLPLAEIAAPWEDDLRAFAPLRERCLLYAP